MSGVVDVVEVVGPAIGGIRQHVTELVRHARGAGVVVTVVGPSIPGGVEVDVPLELGGPGRPWRLRRAASVLGDQPGGLVHAHGMTAGWTAVAARRLGSGPLAARPIVLTAHNVVLGRSALRRLERPLYRRCDLVIAPSPAIARRVRALAPQTQVVEIVPTFPMPTPVRTRAAVRDELGVGVDRPLVVIPARLHPQKDHDTMLRAIASITGERPGLSVVVVGDGPDSGRVRRLIDELDLADVVIMTGHRSDVADVMVAADVVLCGSIWEAVPLVVLEAMLLGVAVVSSDVGIVGELVDDAGPVLTVVPIGDVAAMAAALAGLIDDPAGRQVLAERGRSLAATRFSPSGLAGSVLALYAEVST